MARKRILLIDTGSVLHYVKHQGGSRLRSADRETYIVFGFLLQLHLLMRKTRATYTVFANDSNPEDSIRSKIYPPYKLKRNTKEKTEEEQALDAIAFPQFNEVKDVVLPEIGYRNCFCFKGLEADDIIGRICKSYPDYEIIIVTSDHDMYQLLTDRICILKPKTMTYYTKKDFEKEFGLKPHMWKRVKAIGGCSSDEVKGVPGVAEKTAIKYLKGQIPSHYKVYENITSQKGRRIINRNKSLVILPRRETPKCEIQHDAVSKIRLQGVAKKYGFKSILGDLENWVRVLKGWSI